MEFRVLNYFLTVAREKTISKAAKILHISQPTLSKQLKELEEEFGKTLFIRGSRSITLTDDGIYLENKGKEIMSLVATTTTNLIANEAIVGNITIGAGETIAFTSVVHTFKLLQKEHPKIRLTLESGNANEILRKVDKGLLDFGLVIDPVDLKNYDRLALPLSNHWGLLVNTLDPLAKNKRICTKDLVQTPLFISSQTLVNHQLVQWFGHDINSLNVIGTYNLLFNASLIVKQNIAAALCIDGIINTENTNLTFIPLSPPLTANVTLVWKKNQFFSNASKAFLNLLMMQHEADISSDSKK